MGIVGITQRVPERFTRPAHWGCDVAQQGEFVMASISSRLPSRFPVGTKFVIESHRRGERQVYSRYLELPDGTFFKLPSWSSARVTAKRSRASRRTATKPLADLIF